jgi:predicted ATPase with chaperone activity
MDSPKTPSTRPYLQDIQDNEIAKRAVEVALVGGHSIAFIYQQGAPGMELLQAAEGMAKDAGIPFQGLAAFPCPCGFFGTATAPCECSLRRIVTYRKTLARRLAGFEMGVALLPPWGKTVRRGEDEEQVMQRVRRARAFDLTDTTLSADCEYLLKVHLGVAGASRKAQILKIAATICRLGSSDRMLCHHLMEATMSQGLFYDLQRLLPDAETATENRIGA